LQREITLVQGLVHLKGLTKLQSLDFSNSRITDTGLAHLKGLANLEKLDLRQTQVTDKGVKKLQQALPNCNIRH
jgi:Leucine-rich repeat (LRR) protein